MFTAIFALMLLQGNGEVSACVGARPMALGGAFVAMAEGSSAVYWNPAGLAWLKSGDAGLTATLNNKCTYNYDLFVSLCSPLAQGWGVGLGYVLSTVAAGAGVLREDWAVASAARAIDDQLAIGGSVRMEAVSFEPESPSTRLRFDIGVMYRLTPKLSAGLLIQDLSAGSSAANIRPGLAIRPDDRSLLTIDVYDMVGAWGRPSGRAGFERLVGDNLALRLGCYGFSPGFSWGALTLGAGLTAGPFRADYAFLGGALGGTHQLGVEVAF